MKIFGITKNLMLVAAFLLPLSLGMIQSKAALDDGGGGTMTVWPPGCSLCGSCDKQVRSVKVDCNDPLAGLSNCNQMAEGVNAEETAALPLQGIAAFKVTSACQQELSAKLESCRSKVSNCSSECSSAMAQLQSLGSTGALASFPHSIPKMIEQQSMCEKGKANNAEIEATLAKVTADRNQIFSILSALIDPSLLQMLLSGRGNPAEVCAQIKARDGEDSSAYKSCLGQGFTAENFNPEKEEMGMDSGKETLSGVTAPPMNSEMPDLYEPSDFAGKSSSAQEQKISPHGSSGGGAMGAAGGGSGSSGNTVYDGRSSSRSSGFNTQIMSDPEGGGGRRGGVGQPRRPTSNQSALSGQQARLMAEGHRTKAQLEAQAKREIRGPHAQGLFQSVTEAYQRYKDEMLP